MYTSGPLKYKVHVLQVKLILEKAYQTGIVYYFMSS